MHRTSSASIMSFYRFSSSISSSFRSSLLHQSAVNVNVPSSQRLIRQKPNIGLADAILPIEKTLSQKLKSNGHSVSNVSSMLKGRNVQGYTCDLFEQKQSRILQIDEFEIIPWSVSGIETSVAVRCGGQGAVCIGFDMGYSEKEIIHAQNIFISHGHMDHVAGVAHHAKKRAIYGLPPATYFAPEDLVEPLKEIGRQYDKMHGKETLLSNLDIRPFNEGDKVDIPGKRLVKAFRTTHRVQSQGYLVYEKVKRLRNDLKDLSSEDIKKRRDLGETVTEENYIPVIAYTGKIMLQVDLY